MGHGFGLAHEYDGYDSFAVTPPAEYKPEGSVKALLWHMTNGEESYMKSSHADKDYNRIEGDQNLKADALEEGIAIRVQLNLAVGEYRPT